MTVVALLLIIVAAGGSGLMVAFLAWILHRINQLEEGRSLRGPELRQLIEQVEALQAELVSMRADVAELAERADFTERLLGGGSGPGDARAGTREPDGIDAPPTG